MFLDLLMQELGETKEAGTQTRFCCPFCSESDHKFYVDNEKGIYICFKCDAKGNPVGFVQDYFGVAYPEAAEILLSFDYDVAAFREGNSNSPKQYGSELTPEEQLLLFISREGQPYDEIAPVISKMPAPPTNIKTLMGNFNNPEAFPFFAYLNGRGVTLEQIKQHNMSYVVDGEVSLVDGRTLRLRNSVVFFAFNQKGKAVYWNTRSIDVDPFIKSFNAPSREGEFSKKTVVFNINNACKTDRVIVTEGVFNSLTIGDSGVTTYGKHVTEDQVRIILDATKERQQPIYLWLDTDAWEQMIKTARKIKEFDPDREVYYVTTGDDNDANDLGSAWVNAVDTAFIANAEGELRLRTINFGL